MCLPGTTSAPTMRSDLRTTNNRRNTGSGNFLFGGQISTSEAALATEHEIRRSTISPVVDRFQV